MEGTDKTGTWPFRQGRHSQRELAWRQRRPEVLLISHASRYSLLFRSHFGELVSVATGWPEPSRLPRTALVVDLEGFPVAAWKKLASYSRSNRTAVIILIDDESASRVLLARIACEALISPDSHQELISFIEQSRRHHDFHRAARRLAKSDIPHPLNRFLVELMLSDCASIKSVARGLGFSHATLGRQWRARRQDRSTRLEDLLRMSREIRRKASQNQVQWRADLRRLVQLMLARTADELSRLARH